MNKPKCIRAAPWSLPELLVRERADHVERAVGRRRAGLARDEALALAVEQLEIDHAARLAVRGDEAVEVGPRMREVLGALQVEHRRELHLLAALERGRRGAL